MYERKRERKAKKVIERQIIEKKLNKRKYAKAVREERKKLICDIKKLCLYTIYPFTFHR